jgi:hypothetical protein
MAKQRLVDFRGGINQKISSHMIGDSQGQSAEDVDLSSVRLQGRIKIDASQKAEGSFFYESGNLASNIFDGRWVSIFSEDTDTYLTGATDFALWNKDLYVAFGPDSLNGVLQVYRDGSTSANPLTFEEPSSLTVTTHNYSNSNGFLAPYSSTVPSEVLIQSVAGIDYVPPQTGVTVTASNASQFNPPYILGSYNSSHSRYEWTQSGDPNTYYSTSQTTGNIQQNTGGSAAYTITLSLSTAGQFSPAYVDSGQNFSDNRSGTSSHSFDIFTRSGINTNYYYTSTSNSTLNVVAGNFYTQSGGGTTGGNTVYEPTNTTAGNYDTNNYWSWEKYPDFPSGNVTESNYTDLDWSSQSYSSYDTNWTDTRTGTSNQVFNRYQDSSGTLYYAPQSTLVSPYTGLTAGVFYTQSGGGYDSYEVCDPSGVTSGKYGTSSYYFRWVRDSGNADVTTSNYTNYNGTSNSYTLKTSGWSDPRYNPSSNTFTLEGRTDPIGSSLMNGTFDIYEDSNGVEYYAPTGNAGSAYTSTYNSYTVGTFHTQSGGGTFTSQTGDAYGGISSDYYWKWTETSGGVGNVEAKWAGTVIFTETGVTYAAATTSFNYTYGQNTWTYSRYGSSYQGPHTTGSNPTSYAWAISRTRTGTFYSNYTYTVHQRTSTVGTLSIAWGSSVVYTQSNVAEGSIPTSVNNTENNTVYTYSRVYFRSDYSNNDTKNYSVKRCYTVPSNIQDYTYTAHTRSEAPTTGDTTFQWGGVTKHTQSNVTYANALTSKQLTENSVNYTYQRATTQQVNTNDLKKFGIFRSYVTAVTNVNYTYTLHTNTRTFPATYTYANITDTIPEIIGKPETPDFTYDDARTKLYLEYQNDSDVGSETIDNAQGVNWLVNRDFSLTDDGYYLKTLREETVNSVALPVVSTDSIKATLSSGSNWVFGNTLSNLESTPQRLNFTIGTPSDAGIVSFPLKGYKLERKDSISTVDLGYIAPDTSVTFSYNSSTNAISISGLDTTTPGDYRLKYAGYQDTEVQITLNSGTPTTAKADMTGVVFDGSDALAIELVNGVDTRFLAADFWLEKRIFDTDASTDTDDIYAVIRCFDVFDRNGNAVTSGVIQGTCDFLDVFPNGVSSGGLTSDSQQAGAPTYLKFLKEANNFFFAVGTEDTPDARYGSSTNKADSFLFVSEYNNPRSWPLTGYVEFDGPITGLAPYQGELLVWTQSGTFRVTGSRYDQMRKSKIATTEGMPEGHHRSIAQVNRYLVWVSQSGICIYNGESVSNITRSRFNTFTLTGSSVHAGQFDDTYYVVDDSETGYAVDFAMEGFPIAEIDLTEGSTTTPENANGDTLPPVLVYRPSVNKLYTRRGVIEGSVGNRNLWTYKTRGFDGGAFGSIKLIRNVTINGTGSGKIQIYLDNKPVFKDSNGNSDPQNVEITTSIRTEPARVYVPPTSDTLYGLSVADVWSVELIDWDGVVDWIDTEYEILSGG